MLTVDSQISQISEEALNDLFNETPESTPNANTLIGGKKPEVKDDKKSETKPVEKEDNSIEHLDELPEEETDEEKKKKKEEEDEEDVDEAAKKVKEDEEKLKAAKQKEKDDKKAAKADESVTAILKNTVEYLVDKGIWKDFEGRENLEVTEEVYADLAAKQDAYRLKEQFDELVDSTGPYGKAIINFVSNDGNPDEIIDLFKEQKSVESIDIKSEEGKKNLIQKYYQDVVGWKTEKAQRHINSLISSGELDSEATEIKELFDAHYEEQLAELNSKQAQYINEKKQKEAQFEKTITTSLDTRKDLNDKDKRLIKDSILKYDKKLPDGTLVSDFYLKFAEMQSDPSKYIDLAMFVLDNENYKKRVQKQSETKAAEKTFSFVKGNSALSTKKGSQHERTERFDDTADFNWNITKK